MLSPVQSAITALVAGRRLTADETAEALGVVMRGEATDAQIAGFLVALRMRGEDDEVLFGAATALRAHAIPVPHDLVRLLDTCGTGGDGGHTFNVSTTVAFVCAGAGVPVAKHGNRAISSRAGSADVMEALGVPLESTPDGAALALNEIGFVFLFAPAYHPALRHAAKVRRELGTRTVLNLVGPVVNPARSTHQLIGVYDSARIATVARVLGRLGSHRAIVVCGEDGLDELSPAGPTRWAEWHDGRVMLGETTPEALGLPRWPIEAIGGGSAADNAKLLLGVLEGELGPHRDVTLLNAAWALYAADAVQSPKVGLEMARESIDSGQALGVLERAREAAW